MDHLHLFYKQGLRYFANTVQIFFRNHLHP